jgi:hypothetical protein
MVTSINPNTGDEHSRSAALFALGGVLRQSFGTAPRSFHRRRVGLVVQDDPSGFNLDGERDTAWSERA